MKLRKNGITFGGPTGDWYYLYWWHWLPKNYRYLGYDIMWYDGPHYHIGFWFFNVSWNFTFRELFRG